MSDDKFPPPPGNVTEGTSVLTGVSRSYSEVNPYSAELMIFRPEEFSKMEQPCMDDFLTGTSAWDGEPRYIRKAFIESVSRHKEGSIVRTFSGDFHVITEDPISFGHDMTGRSLRSGRNTEVEVLKTKVREQEQLLMKLEAVISDFTTRIRDLEKLR